MNYQLFQVNQDRIRDVAFRSFDATRKVCVADYHVAYQGDIADSDPTELLERLFRTFNIDHPADFTGYSLSMGDVVVLDKTRIYYCDTIGWRQLEADAITGEFGAV